MDIQEIVMVRMKRLRHQLKLTQTDAAARAGLGSGGQEVWSSWENGRNIKLDDLQRIASALNTDVVTLIATDPDKTLDEQRLIELFRQLPEQQRRGALKVIETVTPMILGHNGQSRDYTVSPPAEHGTANPKVQRGRHPKEKAA